MSPGRAASFPCGVGARHMRGSCATTCATLAVALVLLLGSVVAQRVPMKESNYHTTGYQTQDAERLPWSYADFSSWPPTCRTGRRQSPISFVNVDPSEVLGGDTLRRLKFSSACTFKVDETKMEITNDGNILNVMFETEDTIPGDMSPCTVADPIDKSIKYHFVGLHFHANSEHKFRSIVPDVEMHLVFSTAEQDVAKQKVMQVAILLKASATVNSTSVRALRHILVEGSLPLPHSKTTCFLTEELPLLSLLPKQENYLVYDGSNTFPPCHENVRWVILTSPVLISRLALGKLRNAMDETMPNDFHRFGNARPPQPLNGRRIYRYVDGTNVGPNEGNTKDIWRKHDAPVSDLQPHLITAADAQAWALLMDSAAAEERNAPRINASLERQGGDTVSNKDAGSPDSDGTEAEEANAGDAVGEHNTTTSAAPLFESNTNSAADLATTTTTTAEEPSSAVAANASSQSTDVAGQHASATATSSLAPSTSTTSSTSTSTAPPPTTTSTATPTQKPSSKDNSKHRSTTTKAPSKKKAKSAKEAANEVATSAKQAAGAATVAATGLMAKANPTTVAVVVILILLVIFTIVASCRAWRRPAYVAGVDPHELEPLAGRGNGAYGATEVPVQTPLPSKG